MSRFLFLLSLLVVAIAHYYALNYYHVKQKIIVAPPYQKFSVQFAKLSQPKVEEKKVEEKKVEPKKEKPIRKPLKKLAKKPIKKPVKKVKKVVKKVKEPVKKAQKTVKKVKNIKKVENKVISQKIAQKQKVKSLQKANIYKQDYKSKLRAAIDRNKKYPKVSIRLNEQGLVVVSFRILKNGNFKNIKILQSSSKQRLDKAALKAVKTTDHFLPFPKEILEIHDTFWDIEVPIRFELN